MTEPSATARRLWLAGGVTSVALGSVGIFLPLLPTVPFFILAAFCFARSNRAWEQKLLDHPRFGPHILAWRERGSISRRGKIAATVAFAVSIAVGAATLAMPWLLIPPAAAAISLSWLWTRPE